MTFHALPAGLLPDDNRIEFFNDPADREVCYLLTRGQVMRVIDAPELIKQMIRTDLAKYPAKAEALVELGYVTDSAQLQKYCSCCFGAYDGTPDAVSGRMIHGEYWPCKLRGGSCPVEGKLCDALVVGEKGEYLTVAQIKVFILAAKGKFNKEIADELDISEETVKVHKRNIYKKAGIMNSAELTLLAFKKNLISA